MSTDLALPTYGPSLTPPELLSIPTSNFCDASFETSLTVDLDLVTGSSGARECARMAYDVGGVVLEESSPPRPAGGPCDSRRRDKLGKGALARRHRR